MYPSPKSQRRDAAAASIVVLGTLCLTVPAQAQTPQSRLSLGVEAKDAKGLVAPALDVVAPALDIIAPETSLDKSVAKAQVGKQEQFTLAADVLFAFDKADLSADANSRFDEVAARIKE